MTGQDSGSTDPQRLARYKRVRQLVELALELPPSERAAFFDRNSSDPELVDEVRRMVAASESEWLETPPLESIVSLLAESSLPPGELLGGRYRIERKIGEGGFGEVYLAQDTHLHGRTVAVKRLLAPPVLLEESFRIELESLARMKHPGIVQVFDWGTAPAGHFLVMDYIEGETLRQAIDKGSLSPRRRLEILLQVIDAVAAAHSAGTAHCDLKPENILLREQRPGDLQAVVVDFGIARLAGIVRPKLVAGSGEYMAPEQSTGEGSARSDVYSLGLLAKRLLRVGKTGEIGRVVERAVSQGPQERFVDAGALGKALKAAMSQAQRRRFLGAAVAGTAVVLVSGASWWVLRKRSRSFLELPQVGPITPGNLLFPDRASGRILEFDPRRRIFVQAIPLPGGYSFERQLASALVRRRDLAFLINARKGKPAVLAFTREGIATVSQPLDAQFYQQMALDPNDPFEDTVMGGMQFSETVVAVNPFRNRVAERCRGSKGDYIGLVLDREKRIYASEYSTGEIRRFRQDGSFEGVFARLEGASVSALSIDLSGQLFAAQHQKNQISVISNSGDVPRVIRIPEFSGPAHVCFNPNDGLLYVGNVWNSRLLAVDATGKLAANIDLGGSQAGQGGLVPG